MTLGCLPPAERRDLQDRFDGRLDYTYPSIVQTLEGHIHISYSWSEHRRRAAIRYARVDEDWIKGSYKWGATRGVYQPPAVPGAADMQL